MEDVKIETPTIYNLETVVKILEDTVGKKAVKENLFKLDYLLGGVTEENLIDNNFKCFGPTNKAGYDTYIYRLGNIEAVFIENILHIYDLRN